RRIAGRAVDTVAAERAAGAGLRRVVFGFGGRLGGRLVGTRLTVAIAGRVFVVVVGFVVDGGEDGVEVVGRIDGRTRRGAHDHGRRRKVVKFLHGRSLFDRGRSAVAE